jgi:hypothetical protein
MRASHQTHAKFSEQRNTCGGNHGPFPVCARLTKPTRSFRSSEIPVAETTDRSPYARVSPNPREVFGAASSVGSRKTWEFRSVQSHRSTEQARRGRVRLKMRNFKDMSWGVSGARFRLRRSGYASVRLPLQLETGRTPLSLGLAFTRVALAGELGTFVADRRAGLTLARGRRRYCRAAYLLGAMSPFLFSQLYRH